MAAILAQVRGNAIRTGTNRQHRGTHRIGPRPAPRIPDGSDMIDVDAQSDTLKSKAIRPDRHGLAPAAPAP